MKASEQVLSALNISVKRDTLEIQSNGFITNEDVVLRVNPTKINRIEHQGSGNINGDIYQSMTINHTGSGDVNLKLKTHMKNFEVQSNGSGDFNISTEDYQLNDLVLSKTGSGDSIIQGNIDHILVNLVGSGDNLIKSHANVYGTKLGSGDLIVKGNGQVNVSEMKKKFSY